MASPCSSTNRLGNEPQPPPSLGGLLIGILGLLIGATPTVYTLYVLSMLGMLVRSLTPTPFSMQTRGLYTVSIAATAIGLMICCPLALLCSAMARRLGSRTGSVLAKWASLLFLSPLPLATAGVPVVCWFAGVTLR